MADLSQGVTVAFDTSGPACCAAILSGDTVVADTVEAMTRGQAERLLPLLAMLLAEAGLGWADVDRIGVGTGPGNFTGTRISVAAARGLALSLGRPAVGVSTLEALALGLPRPCVTVVPAPRGVVYVQRHDNGAVHDPRAMSPDALPSAGFDAIPICGSGAAEIAVQTGGTIVKPTASRAVAIARIARDRAMPAARPCPLYLRTADAAPARDLPPAILPR